MDICFYDILKKGEGEINYPTPWASLSFLFKAKEMDTILKELGLTKEQSINQSQVGIDFFNALVDRLKEFGPPKNGVECLNGRNDKTKTYEFNVSFENW